MYMASLLALTALMHMLRVVISKKRAKYTACIKWLLAINCNTGLVCQPGLEIGAP